MKTIIGLTDPAISTEVSMNVFYSCEVPWYVTLPDKTKPALSYIKRTQGFVTWLAAKITGKVD